MYEEWVKLSTKSSSIGARDLSPGEFERWTSLKQVFGNSPPPNCRSPFPVFLAGLVTSCGIQRSHLCSFSLLDCIQVTSLNP